MYVARVWVEPPHQLRLGLEAQLQPRPPMSGVRGEGEALRSASGELGWT